MWFTILPVMPVTFFQMVIIINLNSWINYYFKVGEMASLANYNFVYDEKKVKIYKRILNAFSVLSFVWIVYFSIYISVESIL